MIFGDRILNIEGNMIFEDKHNGLKAVIFFYRGRFATAVLMIPSFTLLACCGKILVAIGIDPESAFYAQ